MKFILPTLVACGLAISVVQGGVIVTGQSIDFTNADFASSDTASQEFAIYSSGSGSDTNVFDAVNMIVGTDGRMNTEFGNQPLEYSVTYKVTTPVGNAITAFTFALNNMTLAGTSGGGNVVNYQYSLDGTTYQNFFTRDNLAAGDSGFVELINQTYNVTLPTFSNTLYLRIYEMGVSTEVSNYFALWSNASGGGSSPNSYIAVTVVPEPSSVALVGAGCFLLTCMARRRLSSKGIPV